MARRSIVAIIACAIAALGGLVVIGLTNPIAARPAMATPPATPTARAQIAATVPIGTVLPSGTLEGSLDAAFCTSIAGWAWDKSRPNEPLQITLYADASPFATIAANDPSEGLAKSGKGNGVHGYHLAVPGNLADGKPHWITAKIAGTDLYLFGSPKMLKCPA